MPTSSGEGGQGRDVQESVKLQKELLWGDYIELLTQARHVETVRMNAVSLALVLTSALAALVTFDGGINRTDLVPSLIITALGILSTGFSLSYLARYDRNKQRAKVVRHELDRRFFPSGSEDRGMSALRKDADNAERSSKSEVHRFYHWILKEAKKTTGTTHLFGVFIAVFVSILGVVLTVLSIQPPTH